MFVGCQHGGVGAVLVGAVHCLGSEGADLVPNTLNRMEDEAQCGECYCQSLRWLPFGGFGVCHFCFDRIQEIRWRQFEESIAREAENGE